MTNLELSSALAHDAKLVLSFITSEPKAKLEDDLVTDSENTVAT